MRLMSTPLSTILIVSFYRTNKTWRIQDRHRQVIKRHFIVHVSIFKGFLFPFAHKFKKEAYILWTLSGRLSDSTMIISKCNAYIALASFAIIAIFAPDPQASCQLKEKYLPANSSSPCHYDDNGFKYRKLANSSIPYHYDDNKFWVLLDDLQRSSNSASNCHHLL